MLNIVKKTIIIEKIDYHSLDQCLLSLLHVYCLYFLIPDPVPIPLCYKCKYKSV